MLITNIKNNTNIPKLEGSSCIALGNFDGMHIGHAAIIEKCLRKSEERNLISTVLTFNPHPKAVLTPSANYKYLSTLEEKIQQIENMGIEHCVIVTFDSLFSKLSPSDFLEKYLINSLNAKAIVTGYNFEFGYKKEGNINWLTENADRYNLEYEAVPEITFEHHNVSSSNIKNLLKTGSVGIAEKLLGRPLSIKGTVIEGKKAGSQLLNTPTANMEISDTFASPALGVYLVRVIYDGNIQYGIANFGLRPSLNKLETPILEVHIFDIEENLYGKNLSIEFIQFLRPERYFDSIAKLAEQINMDIKTAKYVLANLIDHIEQNESRRIF